MSGLFLILMKRISSFWERAYLSINALAIDLSSFSQTTLQLISPSKNEGDSFWDKTKVIIIFSPGLKVPFSGLIKNSFFFKS